MAKFTYKEAYESYRSYCERLGIEPAPRHVWLKINRREHIKNCVELSNLKAKKEQQ